MNSSPSWVSQSIFYHIYPLGLCAAPERNDFSAPPVPRLEMLYPWLDHIQSLGANALYLGPVFESTAHGYDTADYFHVDRRLGTKDTLINFSQEVHRRGMRLILDGVFNHTGRDFWAFRDIQANGTNSRFCDWYSGINFEHRSPCGDPFSYDGWAGNFDLVKLNLNHPEVRSHLLEAVRTWIVDFEIDGLRLDAADVVAPNFLTELASFCRDLRPDFWLMGEIVHGDYRRLANPAMLNSTTNYEGYKGLFSSLADKNYFEIAYALNRQSGAYGIYRDLLLYNFADNHDVDRVASNLKNPRHLYPLYTLLFTMPGVPSIYYGSEWGMKGKRSSHSDRDLRPALSLRDAEQQPDRDLAQSITRLAAIRKQSKALQQGSYKELHVAAEQFAFLRQFENENIIVVLNAAETPASVILPLPSWSGKLVDLLEPSESFPIQSGKATITPLHPCWGRILRVEN